MGSGLSVQVQLERTTFVPGNLIRGVVILSCTSEAVVNSLNAVFLSCINQTWTTSSGSGKHRRTQHHNLDTPIFKQAVPLLSQSQMAAGRIHVQPGQQQTLPFAFQLDNGILPSVPRIGGGNRSLSLTHRVAVEADVKGGFNRTGQVFVTVLAALPAQVHQNPCPRQEQSQAQIDCCCCCSQGTVAQTVQCDRTVFALDRDALNFNVQIDNTKSQADLESVTVSLVALTRPKVGQLSVAPTSAVFATNVPCVTRAGGTGTATGVLRLAPMAAPSVMSNVLDVEYEIHVTSVAGCCTENHTTVLKPILVGHTVDMTGYAAQVMQAYAAAPAMALDPRAFDSMGYGQTQNLYHGGQVPVWQPGMIAPPPPSQFGPPPPAGGGGGGMMMAPPAAYPGGAPPPGYIPDPNQQQQQQQYAAPPPPMGGPQPNAAFGGFAPPPPLMFEQQAAQVKYE